MSVSRVLGVSLLATALWSSSAEAASFKCSASAGRITVLGQTVEPVTANTAGTACAGDNKTLTGPAAGFTGPLTVGALLASTEVFPAQKSIVATGGVADLKVGSLPSLPLTLPQVAVPDAARALLANALKVNSLDLSAVKTAIPVLPTNLVTNLTTALPVNLPTNLVTTLPTDLVDTTSTTLVAALGAIATLPTDLRTDLPTNLRTDLPTNLPTNLVVDATDPALDTIGEVTAQNNLNAAANLANTAANAANTAANAANQTANSKNTDANAANTLVNSLGGNIDAGELANALIWIPAANLANTAANAANTAANAANLDADTKAATANLANQALNTANTALNLAHTVTNAANTATNAANAALNTVRDSIPSSVDIDASGALDSLLAGLLPANKSLPNLDLLRVQGALAYAAGACKNGTPSVAGSSKVDGLSVLGTDLPTDAVVDQLKTLIDSISVDPSNLGLPTLDAASLGLTADQLNLINSIPLGVATDALNQVLANARTAIHSALDALDTIQVLDPTVARIQVLPGLRTQDADSVTQQALRVLVTIAGQQVVSAVVGEAKASKAGVDCSDPVTDPGETGGGSNGGSGGSGGVNGAGDSSNQPDTPEEAALQCSDRRVVLVDVLERGDSVKLTGVAAKSLAGKTADIVFNATGKVVAQAKIAKDGSFDTTAPLPPERLRDSNDARYQAIVGRDESINLKLRRRMIVTSMTSANRKVTITGRVVLPLGKPVQAIELRRRTSCKTEQVVTRFKPRSNGRFSVTVPAPKGLGTAVYRMTTKVRFSADGNGMFQTYTLPRAVDLARR